MPIASMPVKIPAHASGLDGTVITYGSSNTKNVLQVYEDFRPPIYHDLEMADGSVRKALADTGSYRIEYHMAAYLDETGQPVTQE